MGAVVGRVGEVELLGRLPGDPERSSSIILFHTRLSSASEREGHWEVVRRRAGGPAKHLYTFKIDGAMGDSLPADTSVAAAIIACQRKVIDCDRAPPEEINKWSALFLRSAGKLSAASSMQVEETEADGSCWFDSIRRATGWAIGQQKQTVRRVAQVRPRDVLRSSTWRRLSTLNALSPSALLSLPQQPRRRQV